MKTDKHEASTVVQADFGGRPYPDLGDMAEKIMEVVYSYAKDGVPLAASIGVLRLCEDQLIREAQ